ncbi:uncharacterized protein VTP21DRAFT_8229 [Calcarisporiella thermophila]|uniref:uncharacterized protein n=1 Tax=Calcarisporiella thermophila TaxID=911321 RepID=UPI003742C4E6
MGVANLLTALLLFINAIAVLNEERFLARIGWSSTSFHGYGDQGQSIKARMVNLISATRTLMRIPLIVINLLVISYRLILG